MFKQILAITWMNVRSLPDRLGASLVIVVGLAGVVGVLTALLAMSEGLGATLKATGSPDRAMVLRGGSDAELNSGLDRESATLVTEQAGVRKGADGKPLASRELVLIAELPLKRNGSSANVTLRGVEPAAFELRPDLKIVEGRKFQPGLNEMLVGRGASEQFEGASLGQTVRIRGADWTIVGVFASGNAHDSELWIDADTAQSAFGRGGYSSILVALESAEALPAFQAALKADTRLNVDAEAQSAYYARQSGGSTMMIRILTNVVSIVMALGAIFAALNTMYASVSTRTTEIATLRAIGFGPLPVVASVLVESMLLALVGGLIGALIAWLLFNNYAVTTLGAGFTQVVFNFQVSPALVGQGLVIALGVGLVGGLVPAVYSSHSRHRSGMILTVAMPLCVVGIDLLARGTMDAALTLVGAALGSSCALAFLGLASLLRKTEAPPVSWVRAAIVLLAFMLAEVAIAIACAGSLSPVAGLGALFALIFAIRPIHGRFREPWNDEHFSDPVLAGLKAA